MDGEKKFLHDLSGPLAVAFGNASMMLSKLEADPSQVPMDQLIAKLEKIVSSLDRVKNSVEARRDKLKRDGHPTI